jgi:hypothetical protein
MGVPLIDRNISFDPEAKRAFQEKHYDLLPVIEIGNSVITDYEGEPQLIEVLHKEGYL